MIVAVWLAALLWTLLISLTMFSLMMTLTGLLPSGQARAGATISSTSWGSSSDLSRSGLNKQMTLLPGELKLLFRHSIWLNQGSKWCKTPDQWWWCCLVPSKCLWKCSWHCERGSSSTTEVLQTGDDWRSEQQWCDISASGYQASVHNICVRSMTTYPHLNFQFIWLYKLNWINTTNRNVV